MNKIHRSLSLVLSLSSPKALNAHCGFQSVNQRFLLHDQPTRKRRRVFIGRQRPKTLTTSFGFTAQTRRLRQPRPAAAAAADQNSLKFGRWGR